MMYTIYAQDWQGGETSLIRVSSLRCAHVEADMARRHSSTWARVWIEDDEGELQEE